jgi:hypothetical protein
MALPTRATVEDIQIVCSYLMKKPTGATLKEAKAVLDSKRLDGRKLNALRFWGLIEGDDKIKLTPRGRDAVRDHGANQDSVLAGVVHDIEPYSAVVERAAHKGELTVTALEVAAHWHEHFVSQVSENERTLNEQAVCFFQLASGAGLGELIIGRKGSPTRFEFDSSGIQVFIDGVASSPPRQSDEETPEADGEPGDDLTPPEEQRDDSEVLGQGIFIAHGKNKKPLEQLKRILDRFKVPYKVAVEEPNLGRPIGEKVKETMRLCNCAILIFTADEEFSDTDGNTVWRPSENVVYELGATSYLYGKRIVILKEDAVEFPSDFKDLGYISFGKNQLEAKSMDVISELIGFGILKVST